MTNRVALGFVVGLVGLTPSACGGGGPSVSYESPTAFCREYAKRYLAGNYHCFGGEGAPPTVANMTDYCADLDAALARGEISYDKSAAPACLAALDHLFDVGCNGDLLCIEQVVQGHVAEGASCGSFMECAVAGSICRGPERECGGDVCETLPSSFARQGEACSAAHPCQLELRCDVPTGGESGTCVAQTAGGPCELDSDCMPWNEYCDERLCKPRLAVGASCAEQPWACALLSNCDAATGKCVAAGQDGQDCGASVLCWSGSCDEESGVRGTCVAPRPAGDPCIDDWQCASHTCGDAELCIDCPT